MKSSKRRLVYVAAHSIGVLQGNNIKPHVALLHHGHAPALGLRPGVHTAAMDRLHHHRLLDLVLPLHHDLQARRDSQKRRSRRGDAVLEMAKAVLAYVDAEDAKPEDERTLPESKRVVRAAALSPLSFLFNRRKRRTLSFYSTAVNAAHARSDLASLPPQRDLIWDKTYGCRTLKWGIAPTNELNLRCEALYKRVSLHEFKQAIDYTKRARIPGTIKSAGKEEARKLKSFSGEKLQVLLREDKTVRKNLGASYAVDKSLRREAEDLVRTLKADQSKNSRELFRLIKPSLPYIVCSTLISMLITALRSYFHQIGLWVLTIEAGAAGKTEEAFAMLFNLWVGHMLIKLIELPDFTYTRRAKSTFGNNIRNGVLSAMVRQDYEYFDRTPPGVLQDRLNRDADELGENLIGFPKDMLCHLVWIVSNMVQVYNQAPTQFFVAACCPVALMCAFQYFTFKYFRECNERARRVEEEGTAATSEVLRQIKTVRQFASEQRAAATYARRNLARMLIGERVTTFKRSLEVIVWMIFDSGITLTIILGLPYVTRGELSAGQLIDCFCKLNFNVNFCLRESLQQLPRMARLLEPMGRICDLLQAKPTIEPDAHPSYIDVNNAVELAELLDGCKVTKDTKGITRIALTSFAPVMLDTTTENAPTIGAQLVYLSSKDHRYVTPFELLAQADDDEVAASSHTIPTALPTLYAPSSPPSSAPHASTVR